MRLEPIDARQIAPQRAPPTTRKTPSLKKPRYKGAQPQDI